MEDLVGQRLGRYEIVSLLGAGGMGKVYRAKDRDLKRDVAVKVIPEVDDSGQHRARRFSREIRTVAGLTHPNIVQLHDFGSSGGVTYAVMELLKGKDLRQLMKGRPLPTHRAVDIGVSIAHALGEAHHHGVLHRDIKPENIFVTTEEVVKILDFGLARSVASPRPDAVTETMSESLTTPGTILGTTGYQSPEQVRGLELDQRSDIFSLGCVLYEMLAGFNPFRRSTRADTMSAILEHDPEPLTDLHPTLPPAFDLIVDRCLKKEADRRFDSARDVAFALQALSESRTASQPMARPPTRGRRRALGLAAGAAVLAAVLFGGYFGIGRLDSPALPTDRRLAVMRFQPADDDADLKALADGLTALTLEGLSPLSRQTLGDVWTLPRKNMSRERFESLTATRRQFGVNLGLVGRIERRGDNLRLGLSVVRAEDEATIRQSAIEDTIDNLSSFQIAPVVTVARMLDIDLAPATLSELEARSTNHTGAFSSLVRAVGLMTPTLEPPDAFRVESLLDEAIAADPGYAPAREAMASYCLSRYSSSTDRAWLARGTAAVDAALARSPSETTYRLKARLLEAAGDPAAAADALAEGVHRFPSSGFLHLDLGNAALSADRPELAERSFQRAINLVPGYWPAHYWMGQMEFARGRFDAAANQWRAAIACAPEFHGCYTNLGMAYYSLDRHADAREMFEHAVELTEGRDHAVLSNLGTLYFEESRFGDAAELFEQAVALEDASHTYWGNLAQAYAASRDPERAEQPFRRAIEIAEAELADNPDDPYLLSALASYLASLGERSEALDYLDAVISLEPSDPNQMAIIGEAFEDIGMRDRALSWIERAISGGVPVSRFTNRPSMRGLVDDRRFRELVRGASGP